jgi:flagellar biogenesis protein FliO
MPKGFLSLFVGLGFLVFAPVLFAQPAEPPALAAGPGVRDFMWAGGVFVLVLATLILTLKALKRVGRFRAARGRGAVFELRGVQALDNRKYLAAVAVDGRLLIVGVTPDRLTPLGQWPLREEGAEDGLNPAEAGDPDLGFKLPDEDIPPDISVVGPAEEPLK